MFLSFQTLAFPLNLKRIGLLLGLLSMVCLSCCKDDQDSDPVSNEYYVRYELESAFSGAPENMVVTVLDDESDPIIYQMQTGQDMEVTIGPVKRGFEARMQVDVSQFTAQLTPMIFVSKNNGPFALQARVDEQASTATLIYVIDF